MLRVRPALVAIVLTVFVAGSAAGAGRDLHGLWDDRCAECHGHAADFAREHLRLVDGKLSGRRAGDDLRTFLANHYPADADVEDIYRMLLAQAGSEPRFRNQCGSCHGRAVDLVRTGIVRRDGQLYGRRSSWRLDVFLIGHMGTGEYDVPFFVQLLDRVEREVNRP